jgi:hypothetical protein
MFGAKYSRLKFWIVSICLLIPYVILGLILKTIENDEIQESATTPILILSGLVFIISFIWISTLANRIRDYGSNPWISLFALIPLVNIGLALYYGIVKAKNKPEYNENINQKDTSLTKAVYNHSKDMASEIKPALNEYKEKHSYSNTSSKEIITSITNNLEISEDEIYEKIMIEIEEDKKVKSTWAKALAQSDGDDKKANSLYINLRVEKLKEVYQDQVEIQKSQEKKARLKALGGRELNKQEKDFLNKYGVSIFSSNVSISYSSIVINTSSGKKEYTRG